MWEIGWGFWRDFALAVSKKQVASILTFFFRNKTWNKIMLNNYFRFF